MSNIDPPKVRVFCGCGHEVQYHSQTSGHCLLQKLDETECDCVKPDPKHVLHAGVMYAMTPLQTTENGGDSEDK